MREWCECGRCCSLLFLPFLSFLLIFFFVWLVLFFSLRFSLGGLFWSSSVFVLFLGRGVYPDLGEWRPLAQECLGL